MPDDFYLEEFKRRVREQLETSRAAFDGKYTDELIVLCGLSRAEIDKIAPGKIDIQKYDELVAVVKEASKINLSQANLVEEIKKLGHIAANIAKKVPSFARLF